MLQDILHLGKNHRDITLLASRLQPQSRPIWREEDRHWETSLFMARLTGLRLHQGHLNMKTELRPRSITMSMSNKNWVVLVTIHLLDKSHEVLSATTTCSIWEPVNQRLRLSQSFRRSQGEMTRNDQMAHLTSFSTGDKSRMVTGLAPHLLRLIDRLRREDNDWED